MNAPIGSRIRELEGDLAASNLLMKYWKEIAERLQSVKASVSVSDDKKPWVALGIPKSTYYDRKKKGKL